MSAVRIGRRRPLAGRATSFCLSSSGEARSPDPVDGWPTFSIDLAGDRESREVLVPLVRDVLSPCIRSSYELPAVELFEARFRRLIPNERRVLPAHQSFSSLVTCHINLQESANFDSGFFWLDGSTLERTEPKVNCGDAVLHSWDLLHGLDVREGSYFELCLSFKDSFQAVRSGTCPWYAEAANLKEAPEQCGHGLAQLAKKNYREALRYIVEAATASYPAALTTLAEWSWEPPDWLAALVEWSTAGQGPGLPQEVAGDRDTRSRAAIKRWRQAAELGHRAAQTRLGELLAVGVPGRFLQQDTSEATKFLRLADAQADPDASYALGALLLKEGKPGALEALLRAADRGHPRACFQVAEYYREGISVQKDLALSFEYTKWAAHQGDAQALSNLGHLFVNGIGAPKDERKAARLFREAAKLGSPEGEMNYALVLLRGTGGTQINYQAALKWAQKSAAQGHQLAQQQLSTVERMAKMPSPPARSKPENEDDLRYLSVKELRELLQDENIDFSDVFEKSGLVARAASVLLQEDRWDAAPDLEVRIEGGDLGFMSRSDGIDQLRARPFLDTDEDDFEICD